MIIGGGPGGYEAALHARTLGADVTIIEDKGMGGSAVLTDVVPSKTLIASADTMNRFTEAQDLGVHVAGATSDDDSLNGLEVDLEVVNTRLLRLAVTQSRDIRRGLERDGVHIVEGRGSMLDDRTVHVVAADGMEYDLEADAVLIAVGAHPRELGSARPDGERIFNWTQLYSMTDLPEHLVVVGSGVTGAEFASAYNGLGAKVTLVSSRDQVLPGEDADAAEVLENVFERRGLNVMSRSRAATERASGETAALARTTDSLAKAAQSVGGIVGLILCFLVSIAAIVLGYQAKQEIERSGSTEGKGMAQACFILGIVGLVLNLVFVIYRLGLN